jgi:hypothetical protein
MGIMSKAKGKGANWTLQSPQTGKPAALHPAR